MNQDAGLEVLSSKPASFFCCGAFLILFSECLNQFILIYFVNTLSSTIWSAENIGHSLISGLWCDLIPERKAQNQHTADHLPQCHGFPQNRDGDQNGNQGVDVAEDRCFLSG